MAAETITPAPPPLESMAVSTLRIGWLRGQLELKEFFRQREQVFFTLAFPVMLLLIFGSIFSYKIDGSGGLAFAIPLAAVQRFLGRARAAAA